MRITMRFLADRLPASVSNCTVEQAQTLLWIFEDYGEAPEANQDIGQFALPVPDSRSPDISEPILRGLASQGLVVHASESTKTNTRRRPMRKRANVCFSHQSSFMLTAKGLALASSLAAEISPVPPDCSPIVQNPFTVHRSPSTMRLAPPDCPDPAPQPSFVSCADGRRELRMGHIVVKCFRRAAPNQELVLSSFQEQDWPRRILDPIPPKPELDSKRRLRNVILRLNNGRFDPLLRFHGDGTGQAVYWEVPGEI
jgi:hypothetical protein